jgi:hypothetical protein
VNVQRIEREGIAAICPADDTLCTREIPTVTMIGLPVRQTEVTLSEIWLGRSNKQRRFVIAIVLPRP